MGGVGQRGGRGRVGRPTKKCPHTHSEDAGVTCVKETPRFTQTEISSDFVRNAALMAAPVNNAADSVNASPKEGPDSRPLHVPRSKSIAGVDRLKGDKFCRALVVEEVY